MRTTQELDAMLHSTQQILDSGRTARWIRSARDSGEIIRLAQGIFIAAKDYASLRPWEKRCLKILVKFRASPNTVFSHRSAASLHGFAVLSTADERVHIYCRTSSRGSLEGVVKHPRLTDQTPVVTTVCGAKATDALLTILDCAQTLSLREATIVTDSALHQGALNIDELREFLFAHQGLRRGQVHEIANRLSALSESAGETLVRLLLEEMGISYIQQYRVGNYRADFYLPDFDVFIEFDGEIKYTDYAPLDDVLRAERRRERSLMNSGIRIFRTDWETVFSRPHLFKAQLNQFLGKKVPA